VNPTVASTGTSTGTPAGTPAESAPEDAVTAADLRGRRPRFGRLERWLLPLAVLVVVLVVLEILGQAGLIDPLFFSWPSAIWSSLIDYGGGDLWADLQTSGLEFLVGYAFALVGIPLGLLVGYWRRAEYAFDPFINALYATPMVALTPLFVVWFGLGMGSKIAVVSLLAVFPLLINTMDGVKTVDPNLVKAATSFGANRRQLFGHVILPATLPFIATGLRLAVGKALIGVVIGEFIGSIDGIGFRIRSASETFRTDDFLAAVVVLMVVSVLLTALLRMLEERMAPWRSGSGRDGE